MGSRTSSAHSDQGRPGLRRARRIAGLSGRQLARQVGVTAAAVSGWERGLRCPAPQYIAELAKALNLTPEQLIDLIDGR